MTIVETTKSFKRLQTHIRICNTYCCSTATIVARKHLNITLQYTAACPVHITIFCLRSLQNLLQSVHSILFGQYQFCRCICLDNSCLFTDAFVKLNNSLIQTYLFSMLYFLIILVRFIFCVFVPSLFISAKANSCFLT